MGPGDFNDSYYSTAAQVIPVFMLVMLANEYWRHGLAGGDLVRALMNLSSLGFAVLGEMIALDALSSQVEPAKAGNLIILGAIILPILRISFPVIREILADLHRGLPAGLQSWIGWVVPLPIIVFVLLYEVFNDAVAQAVIGIALFAMYAGAAFLASREDRDGESGESIEADD